MEFQLISLTPLRKHAHYNPSIITSLSLTTCIETHIHVVSLQILCFTGSNFTAYLISLTRFLVHTRKRFSRKKKLYGIFQSKSLGRECKKETRICVSSSCMMQISLSWDWSEEEELIAIIYIKNKSGSNSLTAIPYSKNMTFSMKIII